MPHVLWLVVLGALLTGYLLLDGYAFGVGLLLMDLGRDDAERRLLLNAVGPYFLGNEVWIVATAGVLFGAFPDLDGALLTGFYPLVVLVIGGLIVRDAGFWLRSRRESTRWRRVWDWLITGASGALAFGWGLVLGGLLQGVPVGRTGPRGAGLFAPYSLLCGAVFTVLVALHGAVFAAMRAEADLGGRAVRVARRLIIPAAAGIVACVASGFASGATSAAVDRPVLAVAITLAGLLPLAVLVPLLRPTDAGGSGVAGRHGAAFTATALAVALPVIGVGTGLSTRILDQLADDATLGLLAMFLVVVLPLMAASQVWLWRAFRGRIGPASPMYF